MWKKTGHGTAAEISEEDLSNDCIDLVCSLDTFAIWINDTSVLRANNMFRIWRKAVKTCLQIGSNTIRVRVNSPFDYMQQRDAEKRLRVGMCSMKISGDVRACAKWVVPMAGIGLAPTAHICCGRHEAYSTRIADYRLTQEHRSNGEVAVDIQTTCEGKLQPAKKLSSAGKTRK